MSGSDEEEAYRLVRTYSGTFIEVNVVENMDSEEFVYPEQNQGNNLKKYIHVRYFLGFLLVCTACLFHSDLKGWAVGIMIITAICLMYEITIALAKFVLIGLILCLAVSALGTVTIPGIIIVGAILFCMSNK